MIMPEDDRPEAAEKRRRMQETEERLAEYRKKSAEEIQQEYAADKTRQANATGPDYMRQQGYSAADIDRYGMRQKELRAREFYGSCQHRDGQPYSTAETKEHMRGIDFRDEVTVETKKRGE